MSLSEDLQDSTYSNNEGQSGCSLVAPQPAHTASADFLRPLHKFWTMVCVFAGEQLPAGQSIDQTSLKVPDRPARTLPDEANREGDHSGQGPALGREVSLRRCLRSIDWRQPAERPQ